jgi:hypothetical protein
MNKIILLVILGFLMVGLGFIIIRTLIYQRQLAQHLPLSKRKNKQVVFQQASLLLISVFAFVFMLNQTLKQPIYPKNKVDELMQESDYRTMVLDFMASQIESSNQEMSEYADKDVELLGQVEVSQDQRYQLVRVDGHYFLIDEITNQVLAIAANTP